MNAMATSRRRLSALRRHLASEPTAIEFHYVNGRGMGEIVRLVCVAGKLDFKDTRHEGGVSSIPKELRAKSPLGQVPFLDVDGVFLGQTVSLARTCAKLGGIYPQDPVQGGISDMVVDHTQDIHLNVTKLQFTGTPGAAGTKPTPPDELKVKMDDFLGNKLPEMWGKLENLLEGKSYFADDRLTWADVAFFNRANAMIDKDLKTLEAFPNLTALYDRVRALPQIDAWIQKWADLYPNQL